MSSVSFSETKIGRHSKQPWQGSNSGRRKALSCLPRISVMASRELNFALHSGWQAQRSVRLSYSRLALLAYKNVNSVGIQEKKSFRCKFLIHTVLNQQLQVSFHYGIQLLQISFNTPSHKCFPPPLYWLIGWLYSSLDLKGPALPEIAKRKPHMTCLTFAFHCQSV